MWKPVYDPGPWMTFLKRKDIVGLPLMEAKKKYVQEQLLFENYISTLQTLNSMSPGLGGAGGGGAAGGKVPTPPPAKLAGNLCLAYDDGRLSGTLVKIEGGDEYISSTYYMYYEGYNEWWFDRENAPILIWNGSTWGLWAYGDAAAGIWVSNVNYTNYLGQATTSEGPWDEVTAGGTNPNSPIGTQFWSGPNAYRVIANPCTAGTGKELEYSQYHIIAKAFQWDTYPELVPDYISPIGYFDYGYPTLYQTGSSFFTSQSSEPYYRSVVGWNNAQSTYQSNLSVSSSFNFSDLEQPRYNQSTNILGDYNDGIKLNVYKLRIEQGKIPNVITYASTYNVGKGDQTSYIRYGGKSAVNNASAVGDIPYYGEPPGTINAGGLWWNGTGWYMHDQSNPPSAIGSTTLSDASGTYVIGGITYTVTIHQTNANG